MARSRADALLLLAGLALAAAAAGCAKEFTPASVIEDRRVLALVASPPELDASAPGASATVRAVEAAPPDLPPLPAGVTLERRWTFCPFSTGASTGYACAVPACESSLLPGPDGAVVVSPAAELQACLTAAGAALPPELSGGPLPAKVEVLIRYRLVEVTAAAPQPREAVLREAVQRIPVWTRTPTAPLNTLPTFDATPVTVDGAAATACDLSDLAACPPAGTLTRAGPPLTVAARVDPASIQDYGVGDRIAAESFSLSFYTTAGRYDFDRGQATRSQPASSAALKYEEVPAGITEALLWVALRDLRGGEAVAGPYRILIGP